MISRKQRFWLSTCSGVAVGASFPFIYEVTSWQFWVYSLWLILCIEILLWSITRD